MYFLEGPMLRRLNQLHLSSEIERFEDFGLGSTETLPWSWYPLCLCIRGFPYRVGENPAQWAIVEAPGGHLDIFAVQGPLVS